MAVSDREFGELISDVRTLKRDLGTVQTDVSGIDTKVDSIMSRFDRVDGGLKVAMGVSGFLGALVMLIITKVLPIIFTGLPKL